PPLKLRWSAEALAKAEAWAFVRGRIVSSTYRLSTPGERLNPRYHRRELAHVHHSASPCGRLADSRGAWDGVSWRARSADVEARAAAETRARGKTAVRSRQGPADASRGAGGPTGRRGPARARSAAAADLPHRYQLRPRRRHRHGQEGRTGDRPQPERFSSLGGWRSAGGRVVQAVQDRRAAQDAA